MRKCRVWLKTAIGALAMVAVGARFVAAQEVSLSNLALKNTYLKVSAERFEISETQWTSVFTPTTVMCPGRPGTTCTARIEVTVKFAPWHPAKTPTRTCDVGSFGAGSLRRLSFSRLSSGLRTTSKKTYLHMDRSRLAVGL
jgi:hypothetical protein